MNEKIKALYEQAMEQCVSNNMAWEELNPQKFAELIIEECMASVKEDMHSGQSHSDFSDGYDAALAMAVCNIKEKFRITD